MLAQPSAGPLLCVGQCSPGWGIVLAPRASEKRTVDMEVFRPEDLPPMLRVPSILSPLPSPTPFPHFQPRPGAPPPSTHSRSQHRLAACEHGQEKCDAGLRKQMSERSTPKRAANPLLMRGGPFVTKSELCRLSTTKTVMVKYKVADVKVVDAQSAPGSWADQLWLRGTRQPLYGAPSTNQRLTGLVFEAHSITQLKAQGPSRTCNESKEEDRVAEEKISVGSSRSDTQSL